MTITTRVTAGAWIVAGSGWLAASLIATGAADGSTRFYTAETIWLPTQVLLLVGLIGLAQQQAHGNRLLGRAGFGIAIAGRVLFIVAEVVSIATGTTTDTMLPIAALLTAVGMIMAGAALAREHRWHGWRRFAALAMGLYPVVFMFPLAATGTSPELAIALWALPTMAVGIAIPSPPAANPPHRHPQATADIGSGLDQQMKPQPVHGIDRRSTT